MKKQNKAGLKIKRAIIKAYPVNQVMKEVIKNSWYVKWFKDPNHKHFGVYSVPTFKQLKNHPETRAIKNPRNIMLVRIPGRPKTPRPNIKTSPNRNSNSNNSNSNSSTGSFSLHGSNMSRTPSGSNSNASLDRTVRRLRQRVQGPVLFQRIARRRARRRARARRRDETPILNLILRAQARRA